MSRPRVAHGTKRNYVVLAALVVTALAALPAYAGPLPTAAIDETVAVPNGWGGNLVFSTTPTGTAGWWSSQAPSRLTVPAGVRYVRVGASIEFGGSWTVCQIRPSYDHGQHVAGTS